MKKKPLPDCFKKQRLLHDGKISADDLIAVGDTYFEAGLLYDAAAFYRKADFQDGLKRLRSVALEDGDSFLYQMLVQRSQTPASRAEWEGLGNRAMSLGKFSHAVRAFRASENEAALKSAEEQAEKAGAR